MTGPLRTDARYINIAQTLSGFGPVDVYYFGADPGDSQLFAGDVSLIPCRSGNERRARLLRHSLFHREYDFVFDQVRDRGLRYDIVLANDLPVLRTGWRLARLYGAWLVYGSDELFVETLNQFFPSDAPWPKSSIFAALIAVMRHFGSRAERRLWRGIDLLVVPNQSCRDYLLGRYGTVLSCVLMSCPRLAEYPRTDRIRQQLGLPADRPIVLYQGMMNRGRALEQLVRSSRHFADGITLVLLGQGPLRDPLQDLARREGLTERVVFLPAVPYRELLSYTASATAGVLLLDRTNLSKEYALANKIFEYMACGLPLLVSDSPEQAAVVAAAECGDVVPLGDAQSIGGAINRLLADPERLTILGHNARAAFRREFNWETQAQRLRESIEAMLARPPASRSRLTHAPGG
jgi:glycosyltransferase involved in cell wall biosynthesis